MSVRLYSDSHLYRTGSLKWTGITTASGEPTIGAWVAEMDFGTAPEVADAMKGAIDDGLLGYSPPGWSRASRARPPSSRSAASAGTWRPRTYAS